MTERQRRQAKEEGINLDKVQRGCEHIFRYLDEKGFSLLEAKYLMSSIGIIMDDITKFDPLRKIARFDYSSSVSNVFS